MNSLKFLSSFSFLLPLAMLVLCSETAPGLAFGGTGLCSYRVRGVGGSRAEHLTVESDTIIISLQSLLIVILIIIGIPSPTHSLTQA